MNALQYVGVFFTYWSLLASGALCNRAKEEAVLQLSAVTNGSCVSTGTSTEEASSSTALCPSAGC